jgi:transposase InsO family protein
MQTKCSYKHGYMRERKRCGPRRNLGFYALRSKNFGLKSELVHHREYLDLDRDAARRELFAYIEGYYNRQRIHSAIGYITPDQPAKSA